VNVQDHAGLVGYPPPMRLSAGERAIVRTNSQDASIVNGAGIQVTAIEPALALAWQQGQLRFANERLDVVLESVNRYARQEVVLAEPQSGQLTYTGTVLREHVDEWIENLPNIFPLKPVRLKDGAVVFVSRAD
jgi:ferric-dicitrate binding protein FerR (iron transport regulator)